MTKLININRFSKSIHAKLFTIFSLSFLVFILIQIQFETLLDRDLYFHVKIADLTLKDGLVTRLPWMQQSIMKDTYSSFHLLFQLLLVPFVSWCDDLISAAKYANAFFFSITTTSYFLLLREFNCRNITAGLTFFILGSPLFFVRLLHGRGVTLFISFIFIFIILLNRKRRFPLAIISMISLLTYPGFPILIAISLVYFAKHKGDHFLSVIYTLSGITIGIIIHPAFPANLNAYTIEFAGRFFEAEEIPKTGEWSPLPSNIFLAGTAPLLLYFLALRFLSHRLKLLQIEALTLLLLLGLTKAFRYYEYFVPLLSFFVSVNFGTISERLISRAGTLFHRAALLSVTVYSIAFIHTNLSATIEENSDKNFFKAAAWLRDNTSKHEIAILPWDYFPFFFYSNTHNYYLNGLNPAYAYQFDIENHNRVEDLFHGRVTNINETCKILRAQFIILPTHKQFIPARYTIEVIHKLQPNFLNETVRIYKCPQS